MQTRASGLAKEASSDALKSSLDLEGWKPNSASPLFSNPTVPEGTACAPAGDSKWHQLPCPLAELPEGSAHECPWRAEGAFKPWKSCCPGGT